MNGELPPNEVLLVCLHCGNRDSISIVPPECSAECGRAMRVDHSDTLRLDKAERLFRRLTVDDERSPMWLDRNGNWNVIGDLAAYPTFRAALDAYPESAPPREEDK